METEEGADGRRFVRVSKTNKTKQTNIHRFALFCGGAKRGGLSGGGFDVDVDGGYVCYKRDGRDGGRRIPNRCRFLESLMGF